MDEYYEDDRPGTPEEEEAAMTPEILESILVASLPKHMFVSVRQEPDSHRYIVIVAVHAGTGFALSESEASDPRFVETKVKQVLESFRSVDLVAVDLVDEIFS